MPSVPMTSLSGLNSDYMQQLHVLVLCHFWIHHNKPILSLRTGRSGISAYCRLTGRALQYMSVHVHVHVMQYRSQFTIAFLISEVTGAVHRNSFKRRMSRNLTSSAAHFMALVLICDDSDRGGSRDRSWGGAELW